MTFEPRNALAVYGTLVPGEVNHHVVSNIKGRWIDGIVRGYVFDITWGHADGYDGFYADKDGHQVAVSVLVSDELDRHWNNIDRFEGPGYRRTEVDVFDHGQGDADDQSVIGRAFIYECLTDND